MKYVASYFLHWMVEHTRATSTQTYIFHADSEDEACVKYWEFRFSHPSNRNVELEFFAPQRIDDFGSSVYIENYGDPRFRKEAWKGVPSEVRKVHGKQAEKWYGS